MKYKIKHWIKKTCLSIFVRLSEDSNYIKHCKNEVPKWLKGEEGPNRWVAEGTIELLAVLDYQGHSGASIGFALNFFERMAMFKPWGPLTGEEHEWAEPYDEKGTRQNKRYSKIFLRKDGTAYNIQGRIFHDGDHDYYTSGDSFVDIEFPYVVQEPEVVDTRLI